jgi:hypothetical protein
MGFQPRSSGMAMHSTGGTVSFIARSGCCVYRSRRKACARTLRVEVDMARPMQISRTIGLAALIALLGLAGCTYERPGYGGYDYGGYGYGDGRYYGNDYPEGDYGYQNDRPYGYRYDRPYGYRYDRPYGYRYEPQYRQPYRYQYRYGGDYCYYHRCNSDDDED